ncbi:hypothetical protein R1sor_007893 [Riccia sorocarpa]|uniref:Uncharacterized protein n=1 Tax=Riccia sorocarpa TaxID=122646 RepID=A0ABD3HV98_9MARC
MRMNTLEDLKGTPILRLLAADRTGTLPDGHTEGEGPLSRAMSFVQEQVEASREGGLQITDPSLWRWDRDKHEGTTTTWERSNKEWRFILRPEYNLRARYNASWGLNWDTGKWEGLWKHLWKARLFPRDKLWVWRVINKDPYGVIDAEQSLMGAGILHQLKPHVYAYEEGVGTWWSPTNSGTEENDRRMDRRNAREGNRAREQNPAEDLEGTHSPTATFGPAWGNTDLRRELELLGFREVDLEDVHRLDAREAGDFQ